MSANTIAGVVAVGAVVFAVMLGQYLHMKDRGIDRFKEFWESETDLVWLAGLMHDLAFIGAPAAVFIGYNDKDWQLFNITLTWFLLFVLAEYKLTQRAKLINKMQRITS